MASAKLNVQITARLIKERASQMLAFRSRNGFIVRWWTRIKKHAQFRQTKRTIGSVAKV